MDQDASPSTAIRKTASAERSVSANEIIRAEANFLQFPFFSLDTKRLKNHPGITCFARKRIDGQEHEVRIRITRNDDFAFPGPLARKIHFALLGKLQRTQRHPYENPVTWTWNELAKLIGLKQCSGRDIQQMKDAIASTHAAVITTAFSLRADDRDSPLKKRQRGHRLYDEYVFLDDTMPDGTPADKNGLWFSDWFISNLNNMHSGPLNYDKWLQLNSTSTIASRLYEYLTYNFAPGNPQLRINYPTLAQFLPVRIERYLSDARKQMEPAFEQLRQQGVIARHEWTTSRDQQIQICINPGTLLLPTARKPQGVPVTNEVLDEASQLVRAFHECWTARTETTATPKEREHAANVIAQHGYEIAVQWLPKVVSAMRRGFPDAKTFGATLKYWDEVAKLESTRAKQSAVNAEEQARMNEAQQREAQQKAEKAKLRQLWSTLGEPDRRSILTAVESSADSYVQRKIRAGQIDDPLVEIACLQELKQQQNADAKPIAA